MRYRASEDASSRQHHRRHDELPETRKLMEVEWRWRKITDSWKPSCTADLASQIHRTPPVKIGDNPKVTTEVSQVRDWSPHPNQIHLISWLILDGNTAQRCWSWSPLMVSQMNGTRSSSIFVRSLISGLTVRSEIVCLLAFREKPWRSSGVSQRKHTQPTVICMTLWKQGLVTWSYCQ